MPDVCLVLMPYANVEHPSLALGLLKAALVKHNISTRVHYANLLFAERLGVRRYFYMSESQEQAGEWTFARQVFGSSLKDHDGYLERCSTRRGVLLDVRAHVPEFIEQVARAVLAEDPRIVGCSSSFQQHCASLALLRRIKELRPTVVTLMGGASCEESMGLVTLREIPWLDYAVSGDADRLLPELCRGLLDGEGPIAQSDLPEGVYGPQLRDSGTGDQAVSRATVHNLDELPYPDYEDYFSDLRSLAIAKDIAPGLLIETSRGCWWGQKKACLFCGLNGNGLCYRVKSTQRTLDELAFLSGKYGLRKFQASDPVMPLRHTDTLLRELRAQKADYRLFYETVGSLTREQLSTMAAAGVRFIQPGIESLHDGHLRLLNKATSAWQNVQLLKWCMQNGICALWGYLTNIPGEKDEWNEEVAAWLPLIYHLQPPYYSTHLRYDRFSELANHPERYGLQLEPAWYYQHVYPFSSDSMKSFAYVFQDTSRQNVAALQAKAPSLQALFKRLSEWQGLFMASRPDIARRDIAEHRPRLLMHDDGGAISISDSRPCAVRKDQVLQGLDAEVYRTCDSAKTMSMILRGLERRQTRVTAGEVTAVIDRLHESKLILRLDSRYLSLAVPASHPEILPIEERPNGFVRIPRIDSIMTAVTARAL